MKTIELSINIAMDVEQLLNGGYYPLKSFHNKKDLESVLIKMKLTNGKIWPIPILFPIKNDTNIKKNEKVLLKYNNKKLATLKISSIFNFNIDKIIKLFFGTKDKTHPGVIEMEKWPNQFITGKLEREGDLHDILKINALRPLEVKKTIKKKKWNTIVGFHTRNPPHRAHEFLHKTTLEMVDGILIHPVIGSKKSGDFSKDAIIKGYKEYIKKYLPEENVIFTPLLTYSRYGGPKEAIFTAIIRRNYGCTHFIVGRDHTGVKEFYGKYDSQKIFTKYPEIGIKIFNFDEPYFCKKCNQITTEKTCPHKKAHHISISGTEIRKAMMEKNKKMPNYIIREEVLKILQKIKNPVDG